MFRKIELQKHEQSRMPEFRSSCDPIADAGRTIRDRLDALRPKTDLKYWR